MITSQLRITGHDGGRLEFAHDGNDLDLDNKTIYSMLFMTLKNFHEANPNCVLDHKIIMYRQVQKVHTHQDWTKVTDECKDCTETLCNTHQQISLLINLETLPNESV